MGRKNSDFGSDFDTDDDDDIDDDNDNDTGAYQLHLFQFLNF